MQKNFVTTIAEQQEAMMSKTIGAHDLVTELTKAHLPLDVAHDKASDDARLIFLGLLAIAEQLKEARTDPRT